MPRDSRPTGYGVTEQRKPREYTQDEMRAARIALGIETTETEEVAG